MTKKNVQSTVLVATDQAFAAETADVERVLRNLAEANHGKINAFDLSQLRVPSGGGLAWTIQDKPVETITGVIIHHHPARAFYDEPFGAGTHRPPACQSMDGITGYGVPGGACVTCPNAVFGSKLRSDGKPSRAPACSNGHAVYILSPASRLPTLLRLPAESIRPFRDYLNALALGEAYGESYGPREVMTEFGLKQALNADNIKYSLVTFKATGLVREALMDKLGTYGATLKASMARPQIAAAVASQKPLFSEVDDDDIPEHVRKRVHD